MTGNKRFTIAYRQDCFMSRKWFLSMARENGPSISNCATTNRTEFVDDTFGRGTGGRIRSIDQGEGFRIVIGILAYRSLPPMISRSGDPVGSFFIGILIVHPIVTSSPLRLVF